MTQDNLPKTGQAFEKALKGILRPITRALIANGVTLQSFYRLMKESYVDVAVDVLGEETTDSRISVATGVHRRDVKALRTADDGSGATLRRKVSLMTTVVGRWLSGEDTTDENGNPLPLPRAGQDEPNFETLVQSVNLDVRPKTVLDELIHQKLVSVKDNMVHLSIDALVGPAMLDQQVHFFALNIGDHLNAAVENLLSDDAPHLERAVFYNHLTADSVTEIENYARERSNALLLEVNRKARALQDKDVATGQGSARFRFGVFFYNEEEDHPPQEQNADD